MCKARIAAALSASLIPFLVACGGGGGGGDEHPETPGEVGGNNPTPGPQPAEQSFTVINAVQATDNTDWMSTQLTAERAKGVPLMAVRPEANQRVTQNPPGFSWPYPRFTNAAPNAAFTLEIRHPDQHVEQINTTNNWWLPRTLFAPGSYQWRVTTRATGGTSTTVQTGEWRDFTIDPQAQSLFASTQLSIVATDANWYAYIAAQPHPRILSDAMLNQLKPSFSQERKAIWDALLAKVVIRLSDPAQAPSAAPGPNNGSAAWTLALARQATDENDRIEDAALVWRVLRTSNSAADLALANQVFLDLKQRLLNLASWDSTAINGQDSSTDSAVRTILWAMASGFDHAYPLLSAGERTTLINAIATRAAQIESRVFGASNTLLRYPLDSHASAAIQSLAATTAVMAGDQGSAGTQFNAAKFAQIVPFSYIYAHPWGGSDGGWGNGGAYGEWLMNNLFPYFDVLNGVTGVNPYHLQQMQNYPRYRLYAEPFGTLQSPFGDGAAIEGPQSAYYAYWLATRLPNPITKWMVSKQPLSERQTALSRTLISPVVSDISSTAPPATEHSAFFESIGEVYMHSDLTDTNRTSIHFRASPLGSYNHSHADQNHFILGSKGKALLIDTGYYDYFLSPHAKTWARQTQAHNAITYDGGVGQRISSSGMPTDYSASGRVTAYLETNAFSATTGDATAAYDPNTITRAVRSLVYIRPGLLLVHDDLVAKIPVRWEWNFHSVNAAQIFGGAQGYVQINNSAATACIRQIGGDKYASVQLSSGFPTNPELTGFATQHHGAWKVSTASTSFQSLMLIDVGCQLASAPAVTTQGRQLTVTVGGRWFRFGPGQLPAYAQ